MKPQVKPLIPEPVSSQGQTAERPNLEDVSVGRPNAKKPQMVVETALLENDINQSLDFNKLKEDMDWINR